MYLENQLLTYLLSLDLPLNKFGFNSFNFASNLYPHYSPKH